MEVLFITDYVIETHSSLRHVTKDKIELAMSRAQDVIKRIKLSEYLKDSKFKIFYLGIETRKGNCIALKITKLRNNKYRYQLVSCHINEIDYIIKDDSWVIL